MTKPQGYLLCQLFLLLLHGTLRTFHQKNPGYSFLRRLLHVPDSENGSVFVRSSLRERLTLIVGELYQDTNLLLLWCGRIYEIISK